MPIVSVKEREIRGVKPTRQNGAERGIASLAQRLGAAQQGVDERVHRAIPGPPPVYDFATEPRLEPIQPGPRMARIRGRWNAVQVIREASAPMVRRPLAGRDRQRWAVRVRATGATRRSAVPPTRPIACFLYQIDDRRDLGSLCRLAVAGRGARLSAPPTLLESRSAWGPPSPRPPRSRIAGFRGRGLLKTPSARARSIHYMATTSPSRARWWPPTSTGLRNIG